MIKTQHCPNCEAQAAEIDRLKTLIDATAEHWMVLQSKHPIQWEGAIDSAMAAACAEIEALLADNAKLREALAPFVDFWEWDTVKTFMDYPVSQCFTPATFLRAVKTFHETSETFTRSSDT